MAEIEDARADSVSSPITKRVYNMALDEFYAWFQAPTTATADVTICSDDCAKKSLVCTPLDGTWGNAFATCGSGGGGKLYEYTIHVGTTTCTILAALSIGPPEQECSDAAAGNAFLSAN